MLGLAFLTIQPLMAATITVDDNPCTLTDAILSANADMDQGTCQGVDPYGADTIVLDVDVTLTVADTLNSDLQGEGGGDYAGLPTITTDITIEAGAASVIQRDPSLGCVESDPVAFRVFTVLGSVALTLDGLTIRHGCAASGGEGGAVLVLNGGSLSLDDCVFEDNAAIAGSTTSGGAISLRGPGALSITGSELALNRAIGIGSGAQGGSIYSTGTVSIEGSTFSQNRAEGTAFSASGGAIDIRASSGRLELLDSSLFVGNEASAPSQSAFGGALSVSSNSSAGTISDNSFVDNTAISGNVGIVRGGGLYLHGTTDALLGNALLGNLARGGDATSGDGGDAGGGGAWVRGVTSAERNLIRGNVARGGDSDTGSGGDAFGGGLCAATGFVASDISLIGNEARGGDGGIDGGTAEGGGLYAALDSASTNLVVAQNFAAGGTGGSGTGGSARGGGWGLAEEDYAYGSHLTIVDNEARAGDAATPGEALGGGFHMIYDYTFNLAASLLADNRVTPVGSPSIDNDCDWSFNTVDASLGHNLIEVPGTCGFTNAPTDIVGTDPMVALVRDNGCWTLLPDGTCLPTVSFTSDGSAAIDAGSCTVSGATEDARDFARPFDVPLAPDVDDGCDIGSLEWTDADADGAEDGIDNCLGLFERVRDGPPTHDTSIPQARALHCNKSSLHERSEPKPMASVRTKFTPGRNCRERSSHGRRRGDRGVRRASHPICTRGMA